MILTHANHGFMTLAETVHNKRCASLMSSGSTTLKNAVGIGGANINRRALRGHSLRGLQALAVGRLPRSGRIFRTSLIRFIGMTAMMQQLRLGRQSIGLR